MYSAETDCFSQDEIQLLVEEIKDYAIFILNTEGHVASWNAGAKVIKGYSAEEILGQHFSCFYTAKDIELGKPAHALQVAASTGRYEEQGWRARKDGSRFWAEVIITAWRDGTGNLRGFGTVSRDVTERRRAEEALAERTAELISVNKELEAFAYSVSHDLRAPLRHIDGFVDLLRKQADFTLNSQAQHYLDIIDAAAKKMGALIDDLLSFSRIGRAELVRRPINMEPLVKGVIQEVESAAAGRLIAWHTGTLPAVEADPAMLRMVLTNLLGNAIKFTGQREQPRIEVGCLMDQPGEVVFFVRDNGAGFDRRYADKLFGVFQRLHRTDEFEGTGIGLANVKRIIHRHGGRVWAEGQVDAGATFYFSLPAPAQQG